ncbi:OEP61 [Acrasis kona]|uniref:OEP61 n=1 Tax=Acrasis kona TaxID=1008807 RepID=A0AAW2ZBV2_9EUKA
MTEHQKSGSEEVTEKPAPKISKYSGKIQMPKEVFNIPQHNQVDFDAIVEGSDGDGDPIRKKILVQGNGCLPNEGAKIKYIQQGFFLCPVNNDASKFNQLESDTNALGFNTRELAFKNNNSQHPLYEKCLMTMRQGEESVFEIPSRFRIDGDKEIYMNELRVPANVPSYYWFRATNVVRNRLKPDSFEERMENVNIEKQEGNDFYRKKDFKNASHSYNRAKNLVTDVREKLNEQQSSIMRNLKINIVMNLVKSYYQEKKHESCVKEVSDFFKQFWVPDLDKPRLVLYFAEMLYIRGKVFQLGGILLKESKEDLERAIEVLDLKMTLTNELQGLSDRLRQNVLNDLQTSKDKMKREKRSHDLRMKKAFMKVINESPYEEEMQEQRRAHIEQEERLAGRKVWFVNGTEIVDELKE